MVKTKSIFLSIFFALLTLINIPFFSFDNSHFPTTRITSSTFDYYHLIEYNSYFPHQKIENTYHSYFERLCKFTHKSVFNFYVAINCFSNLFFINRSYNYIGFSKIILLSLGSADIIFPFHNFW